MRTALGMRAAALAAAALLAGVFAVALSHSARGDAAPTVPRPAVGAWGGWTAALAGVAPAVPRKGRPGDCGWAVMPATTGVIHPVLPCGARVFLEYRGRRALTRVVAQSPIGEGRQLELTPRLADALGLQGIRQLRWAFSR